jgi:hypothetical protein
VRFGNRCLDVRDAPAAETRKVMVGPGVGVEAGSWPGQFTEQPHMNEQPEVPIDGTQAHPWRSADDQSVDFLGSGVRLDAPDHVEHRVAWRGQPESPVPQYDLGTLTTPGWRASCTALPTRISGTILISINLARMIGTIRGLPFTVKKLQGVVSGWLVVSATPRLPPSRWRLSALGDPPLWRELRDREYRE